MSLPFHSYVRVLISMLLASCFVEVAAADDWPQWMGPRRDNVWRESGLITKFPAGGPRRVWSSPVAGGYAGPAVAGGRVVVTDYVTSDNVKIANFERAQFTGTERILCLDANDGRQLWKLEHPVTYTLSYPAGPRCTPVIDGDMVYVLGAEGALHCLRMSDGSVVWKKDLKSAYNTKSALWGYAGHPLIDGNRLLVVVGGRGSHIVAFEKTTGAELWRAQSAPEQGYSPPTILELAGKRQLILLTPNATTSVDPGNGSEYWSVPYEATSGSIIMSPVMWNNYLFVGGYDGKNLMLQVNDDDPEILWQDERGKGLSPVNVQPIVDDGIMYGCHQSGDLIAVEIPSGKRLWETSQPISPTAQGSGTAFIVKQGDRYWLFNENGELVIAQLSREGYTEIDRAKIIDPTNVAFGRDVVWCMPAFANQRIYVRNDEACVCVDLAN